MEQEGWAGPGLGEAGCRRRGGGITQAISAGRNAGLQLRPTGKALTALALIIWKQTSPGVP